MLTFYRRLPRTKGWPALSICLALLTFNAACGNSKSAQGTSGTGGSTAGAGGQVVTSTGGGGPGGAAGAISSALGGAGGAGGSAAANGGASGSSGGGAIGTDGGIDGPDAGETLFGCSPLQPDGGWTWDGPPPAATECIRGQQFCDNGKCFDLSTVNCSQTPTCLCVDHGYVNCHCSDDGRGAVTHLGCDKI